MGWKDYLVPASFRGVGFKVDAGSKSGGRRTVGHEYPKRDIPYAEDMGRRGRRFSIQAYVIGPDYTINRDALEDAMEADGPGLLIHPTKGQMLVQPDVYNSQESREEGGMCKFELTFLEAGSPGNAIGSVATQSNVQSRADAAGDAAATSVDKSLGGNEVIST